MSDFTERTRRAATRLALGVIVGSLLVIGSASGVAASSAAPLAPFNDGATRIRPNPNIIDLHEQAWDHITVSANGRRLVVYFWMGARSCNGLGKVDVSRHDGELQVQLWTGVRPRSVGTVCPAYAQLYKTIVRLNRPIIGGAS